MRSPAGSRRLGTATRISASLSRRLSASFRSASDQDPKAAKFAVLPPGHAGFPNRAKRSEGRDSTPIQNAPCFGVCAAVCDLSPKAECVPTFARESECGPFVRQVENRDEKRLGIKFMAAVRRIFFSLLIVGGSQRTGKCMYIKAWRNQWLQMRRSEQFHWQRKATLWLGEGRPLFRRVSPCVRSFSESRVCTHFRS